MHGNFETVFRRGNQVTVDVTQRRSWSRQLLYHCGTQSLDQCIWPPHQLPRKWKLPCHRFKSFRVGIQTTIIGTEKFPSLNLVRCLNSNVCHILDPSVWFSIFKKYSWFTVSRSNYIWCFRERLWNVNLFNWMRSKFTFCVNIFTNTKIIFIR